MVIHYWILGLVAAGFVLYFIVKAPSRAEEEPEMEDGEIEEKDCERP